MSNALCITLGPLALTRSRRASQLEVPTRCHACVHVAQLELTRGNNDLHAAPGYLVLLLRNVGRYIHMWTLEPED